MTFVYTLYSFLKKMAEKQWEVRVLKTEWGRELISEKCAETSLIRVHRNQLHRVERAVNLFDLS